MANRDMNVHSLTGRLTRDPELDEVGNGVKILRLRVASNDARKDASTGEWNEVPSFFDCVVFGTRAEALAKWLKRGMGVALSGRGHVHPRAVHVDGKPVVDAAGKPVRRDHYEVIVDSLRTWGQGSGAGQDKPAAPAPAAAQAAPTAPSEPAPADPPAYDEYAGLLSEDAEF